MSTLCLKSVDVFVCVFFPINYELMFLHVFGLYTYIIYIIYIIYYIYKLSLNQLTLGPNLNDPFGEVISLGS